MKLPAIRKLTKNELLLFIFALMGVGIRIGVFILNRDNALPEDLGEAGWEKLSISLYWIRDPFAPFLTIYGPLHTDIIGLLWLISQKHIIILSRLVNLVFSVAALPVFYECVKEIFGSRRVALTALALACIFPADIMCASVPVPETIAFFLMFSSMLTAHKYIKTGKPYLFILSLVCVNMAGMLRYELWPCAVFFAVWIFAASVPRRLNSAVLYLTGALLFPIYWMHASMNRGEGHPLASFQEAAQLTNAGLKTVPMPIMISEFARESLLTMSVPLLVLTLAGMLYCAAAKRQRNIFWVMAVFYTVNIVIQPVLRIYHPANLRHIFLPGYLAIPCGAFLLEQIFLRLPASLRGRRIRNILIIITALLFIVPAGRLLGARVHNMRHVVPLDVKDTAKWLKEHIASNPSRALVLELGGCNFYMMTNSMLHPRQYSYFNSVNSRQQTPEHELEWMLETSTHVLTAEPDVLYAKIIKEKKFPHLEFKEEIRIGHWIILSINKIEGEKPKEKKS